MGSLEGLHLLLTYRCVYSCDHCFVWGSPESRGTMSPADVDELLTEAARTGAGRICFEGGEPFVAYPVMLHGLRRARDLGLERGIVTNAFWASSLETAQAWLEPVAEVGVSDLSLSSDEFHGDSAQATDVQLARGAAESLGLPVYTMSCALAAPGREEGDVRFRGRAAVRLAPNAGRRRPWRELDRCPHEDLERPGRVHVDACGCIHLCQGLSAGNWRQRPLADIMADYRPEDHPIVRPLLAGGPAALAREFGLHDLTTAGACYADACHLCYEARLRLRPRFPEHLGPGQVYGEGDAATSC